MWNDIVTNLSKFSSPILTGIGVGGFPFSIRCAPELDHVQKRLYIEIFDGLPVEPGPASLMCHVHNELLWNLDSFLVRGRLEKGETGWIFYPEKFLKSGASTNPIEQLRGLFKSRSRAKQYLEKRGLSRPQVPWDDIKALRAESRKD